MQIRKSIISGLGALALVVSAQKVFSTPTPEFSTQFDLKALQSSKGFSEIPGKSIERFSAAQPVNFGRRAERPNAHLNAFSRYAVLPHCGGTVELKVAGGNANLIFRDVNNCSNFDILAANGFVVPYGNKKLGGPDGRRGGSFSIPRRFLEWGPNGVIVAIQSNRHHGEPKTRDLIHIRVWAW